ncbi:glycerol dehydrogenase, partial [Penicillium sp. IBT 16267x]
PGSGLKPSKMSPPTDFKLNTGASIPAVGLGTFGAEPGELTKAVLHALKVGYRHLDCALVYGNEHEVGEAIKTSGVPRDQIFITSKLWCTYHDRVSECLEQTLEALQTDYVDLYLIHWPVRQVPDGTGVLVPLNPDGTRKVDWNWDQSKTWKQMEELYRSGKAKAIGVSNWSIPYLEDLSKHWSVIPAVNQVELHPFLPQHALRKWCNDRGILMAAYCPLGSNKSSLLSDHEISAIASRYGVSPGILLISYHVNKGTIVLPKSVKPGRIEQNLAVIEIEEKDLEILDQMAEKSGKAHRVNTPAWAHHLGFDDWYGPGNKNAPVEHGR